MIDVIMQFLGISTFNLSDDIKAFMSIIIVYYIFDFVLDIIRYIVYYIGGRK